MDYITINKYSLVPLYSQLKESIKEAIQNGILKPGDKLPTEHEICNHLICQEPLQDRHFMN